MKKNTRISSRRLFFYVMGALVLTGIFLSSRYSYLLFHSVAEVFSIVVSFSIFLFAWNTMGFARDRDSYLIVLGIAYLFVGAFDLAHMLSYKGMNIIAGDEADYATQTWIVARYIESLSLLALPFLFNRRVNHRAVFTGYLAVSLVLFLLIFRFRLFPECYIEGTGLTLFKVISEYIICLILVAAGTVLYQRRGEVDAVMFRLLLASIGFTIASEIAFTGYVSVYGPANLVGHLLKIVSFYLVYRAIVAHGLLRPYKSMFRELAASKSELERYSQALESSVAERTKELEESNRELRYLSGQLVTAEQKERRRIARDLHDSIGQSLSAIKLATENIADSLGRRFDNKDRAALGKIVSMSREAIKEVRRIIMDLRPSALDNGIVATIDSLCSEFDRVHPETRVEKEVEIEEQRLPEEVKTVIFRLLQESLNNIGKHSGAGQVNLRLSDRNGRIRFEVSDNGKGFDPGKVNAAGDEGETGFGLSGMRERAELSGAQFQIRSRDGGGTSIVAVWHLQAEQSRSAYTG
ncbi:MAG: hypothetical protein KGY38_02845 [Desulfobacterales bacterium]|nr:hypothetical protein [Desulfobacterales bacterium]